MDEQTMTAQDDIAWANVKDVSTKIALALKDKFDGSPMHSHPTVIIASLVTVYAAILEMLPDDTKLRFFITAMLGFADHVDEPHKSELLESLEVFRQANP